MSILIEQQKRYCDNCRSLRRLMNEVNNRTIRLLVDYVHIEDEEISRTVRPYEAKVRLVCPECEEGHIFHFKG